MTFPKNCACGLSYTAEQWAKLRLVGYGMCLPADETGPEIHHEHRDCKCGSTLTIYVGADHPDPCPLR